MANASSGIVVSEDLKSQFAEAKSDKALLLKVQIKDEAFVVCATEPRTGSTEDDFDCAADQLDEDEPCYLLFFSVSTKGGMWVLIAYCPETASVRDKMLYASSRLALKDGLGGAQFADDFFIEHQDDCCLEEYTETVDDDQAVDVRTENEKLQEEGAKSSIGWAAKANAMATLPIDITEPAAIGLKAFQAGSTNFVFLNLSMEEESLECPDASNKALDDIADMFPAKEPRYVLYRWEHSQGTKTIMIYYCPESCHPRFKMFYSTCVANIVGVCTVLKIDLDKKLEISDPAEISVENLEYQLFPKKEEKVSFNKPQARGRKGKRRVKKVKW